MLIDTYFSCTISFFTLFCRRTTTVVISICYDSDDTASEQDYWKDGVVRSEMDIHTCL